MDALRYIATYVLAVALLPLIALGFLTCLVASGTAAGWLGASRLLDWMAD